jgi:hypothetical protein
MSQFAICINNNHFASLIVGKVYRYLPDPEAEKLGLIRVIDEEMSESDGYLYPSEMFVPIQLPEVAERALLALAG